MHVKNARDFAVFSGIQMKADAVFSCFGIRCPFPIEGESALLYRMRIAVLLKTMIDQDSKPFRIVKDAMFSQLELQSMPKQRPHLWFR